MKTETEIKKEISDYLTGIGYKVKRLHAGRVRYNMHNNEKGTLDLVALGMKGEAIFIETKRPGEHLKPSQVDEAVDLVERGFKVIVAWSIESLIEGMK